MSVPGFSFPVRIVLKIIELGRFGLGLVAICYAIFQIAMSTNLITGLICLFLGLAVLKSIRSLVLTSTVLMLCGYAFCKYQHIQFPMPNECLIFTMIVAAIFYKNLHLALIKRVFG